MENLQYYRNDLTEVVKLDGLKNGDNWNIMCNSNPPQQKHLDDAFNQHGRVLEIFSDLGNVVPRTSAKSFARVKGKIEEQQDRELKGRSCSYFQPFSDFIAARIPCHITEISEKIDQLQKIVENHKGSMHLKESWKGDTLNYKTNGGEFSDITQYAYVFFKEIGYPIELQIGETLAFHTFTNDSAIRDKRSQGIADADNGIVDLWDDGFYGDAVKLIVAQANNVSSDVSKEALKAKAIKIFEKKGQTVPEELNQILANI